jgi:RNA polymerase-binding transcription factor DksA
LAGRTEDEHWRAKLTLALATSRRELSSIESELAAARGIRANGGDDDEHDPDGIPLSSVLELLEGQKMRALDRIRHAEDALVLLGEGRYGVCIRCSQPIAPSRLEIKPTSRTCVNCAR